MKMPNRCPGLLAAAIMGLGLPTLHSAADERESLGNARWRRSTPDAASYRRVAGKEAGQESDGNGLTMKVVWCPPGSFAMGPIQVVGGKQVNENQTAEDLVRGLELLDRQGRQQNRPDDDKEEDVAPDANATDGIRPMRRETKVFLFCGYWLGKYEVTRSEWKQLMRTEPWEGRKIVTNGDEFPATYVSWNDATEFCRRLTEQERKAGRLSDHWEYTLPTEAQWERACRARTTTRYSFGDSPAHLADYGWFDANTTAKNEPYPHKAGEKKPNPWGLHDMHGNVLEWCRDWYSSWPPHGGFDPEVTERGSHKVQRGGFWGVTASSCGSGGRFSAPPELKKSEFGFRVALSYVE
jgi:formylglycine-generating enzyme required for sulfatase activity